MSATPALPEVVEADARQERVDELLALVGRYSLPTVAGQKLNALADLVAADPQAPTTVRSKSGVIRDHFADSLVALTLSEIRSASKIADIGSGAGFPGLPLAIALPRARLWLIESRQSKIRFIQRAASVCGLDNVNAVHRRVEECNSLAEGFDAVVARALAPIDVVAEYAAPLMALGGALVVWRGSYDARAERAAALAGEVLGLELARSVPVKPYAEVRDRYLYLMLKVRPTPDRFPRRPGVARRRPLGAEPARA